MLATRRRTYKSPKKKLATSMVVKYKGRTLENNTPTNISGYNTYITRNHLFIDGSEYSNVDDFEVSESSSTLNFLEPNGVWFRGDLYIEPEDADVKLSGFLIYTQESTGNELYKVLKYSNLYKWLDIHIRDLNSGISFHNNYTPGMPTTGIAEANLEGGTINKDLGIIKWGLEYTILINTSNPRGCGPYSLSDSSGNQIKNVLSRINECVGHDFSPTNKDYTTYPNTISFTTVANEDEKINDTKMYIKDMITGNNIGFKINGSNEVLDCLFITNHVVVKNPIFDSLKLEGSNDNLLEYTGTPKGLPYEAHGSITYILHGNNAIAVRNATNGGDAYVSFTINGVHVNYSNYTIVDPDEDGNFTIYMTHYSQEPLLEIFLYGKEYCPIYSLRKYIQNESLYLWFHNY